MFVKIVRRNSVKRILIMGGLRCAMKVSKIDGVDNIIIPEGLSSSLATVYKSEHNGSASKPNRSKSMCSRNYVSVGPQN